jgi:hypothetical protein
MSVQPGQYNIILQRRADYILRLQFKDSNDAPIDLTSWIAYSQIWDKGRTIKYVDFTIEYIDRPDGVIGLKLLAAETEDIPCEAFYDVMLEDSNGFKQYYLEGLVYVSEGYSAP